MIKFGLYVGVYDDIAYGKCACKLGNMYSVLIILIKCRIMCDVYITKFVTKHKNNKLQQHHFVHISQIITPAAVEIAANVNK